MRSHVLVIIISLLAHNVFAQNKLRYLNIATASVSGVYYALGNNICKLINKATHEEKLDIKCSVQATMGSVHNINLLRGTDDVDIAVVQQDIVHKVYNGLTPLNKPMHDLRHLFFLHSDALTILAKDTTALHKLSDLLNKKVNIGAPGTGTRDMVNELMRVKKWTKKDFKVMTELRSNEVSQALCDGKIDVMIQAIGHPNGAIQEATATCRAKILSIDNATIAQMRKRYGYYKRYTIPGNEYMNNAYDIVTVSTPASVVSKVSVSEEKVYDIVKTVFENFDVLRSIHPVFSKLTRRDLAKPDIVPFHPGAERYYREVGLLPYDKNSRH